MIFIFGALALFFAVFFITKGIKSGFLTTPIGELRERKASQARASKKSEEKKQFFFKWQRIIFWVLLAFACTFGLIVAIGGNEPVIVVAFIFLGLSIKFLFWSTIGNAIYYNAQKKKKPKAKSPAIGIADEIRKFKDLLDDGVITQEEFDKKKKDLLR